jgi:DNA-binding PadR family transcriptional regulator
MDETVNVTVPLSAVDLSVLLVLAEGENYGYGIVKAIAEDTAGSIELAPGNLYQVLDRLLVREWIRELPKRDLPAGADARRRYYAITAAGRAAARAEAARLRAMMRRLKRLSLLPEGS